MYHVQIQTFQGYSGVDTAVNVIRLLCKQARDGFPGVGSVTSATGDLRDMRDKRFCPEDYWIAAFLVSNNLMLYDRALHEEITTANIV